MSSNYRPEVQGRHHEYGNYGHLHSTFWYDIANNGFGHGSFRTVYTVHVNLSFVVLCENLAKNKIRAVCLSLLSSHACLFTCYLAYLA